MPGPIDAAYIHVPFCKSKCFYCDFNSYSGREDQIDEYFHALLREIRTVDAYYRNGRESFRTPLRSVYFGGGTPSFVPSSYITAVLLELKNRFLLADNAEITIECNPGTVDLPKMEDYRNAGFTRLSIGLQSGSDELLRKIGRIHTLQQFEECIEYADQTGFANRNIDLMFGLPSQTIEDVRQSVRLVLEKKAVHVSFYSLILEEGTPFYEKYHCTPELLPSEDLEREMYWTGVREFEKSGFLHYEISNLAKPGFICRQNATYWKSREYFGFGAGAHSYQQRTRFANENDIGSYIRKISDAGMPSPAPAAVSSEDLTESARELEFFMLGFRLLEGVDTSEFERCFSKPADSYIKRLSDLVRKGYLTQKGTIFRLTSKGIDFANQVFMEFV